MAGFQDGHSKLQKAIDRRVLDRVKNGIELLKEKYGEDWVDHIDLERLDLASGASCVLGQLYQGYNRGVERLGINSGTMEWGFDVGTHDEVVEEIRASDPDADVWGMLQDAWVYEITNILADRKREAEEALA